jgi:hypothetical protein
VITAERVRGTVGSLSHNCTRIDARTVGACGEVAELNRERAVATEGAKLEARARSLREEIAALRERGGAVAPDPVGEFYAWITGGLISVRDVGFGFPLFFALLIEVVSAFGPITIAAYAEATRSGSRDVTSHVVSKPVMSGRDVARHAAVAVIEPNTGTVVSWLAERGEPTTDSKAISLRELHRDYVRWCRECGLQAALPNLFEEELDRVRELPDLVGKIRKFGDRYYGIRLHEQRSSTHTRVS